MKKEKKTAAERAARVAAAERMLLDGATHGAVAKQIGVQRSYVGGLADALGLTPPGTGQRIRAGVPRRMGFRAQGRSRMVSVSLPVWWGDGATAVTVTWHEGTATIVPVFDAPAVKPA